LKLGTIFTCLELPILSARGSNGSNKGRGGERGGGTAPLTGKQAHCASAVAVFSTGAAPPHSHTQVAVVPKLAEQTGRVPTAAIVSKTNNCGLTRDKQSEVIPVQTFANIRVKDKIEQPLY
jgi:hypothetical protein